MVSVEELQMLQVISVIGWLANIITAPIIVILIASKFGFDEVNKALEYEQPTLNKKLLLFIPFYVFVKAFRTTYYLGKSDSIKELLRRIR